MNDLRSQGLYPIETVAKLLNLSERRIEQLAKKKIIPKAGRGIFDLRATVEAYVRYLQGLRSGAISSDEPSELDRRLLEARVLERESKARQAKYKADILEQSINDNKLSKAVKSLPEKVKSRLRDYDPQLVGLVMLEIDDVVSEILGDAD